MISVLMSTFTPSALQSEQQRVLAAREAEYMSLMEAAGIQTNAHSMDSVVEIEVLTARAIARSL